MYLKELEIGNVKLNNNVFLAPMAGITDRPYRIICEDMGVGLVFSEMVSSKAIFYNDEKTKKLLNTKNEKRPIGIQIFGSEIESMGYGAKYVSQIADIIDINMGCPAPKVVKNGDGSKLLTNLKLVGEIVENVVKSTDKPVSVKIRKGWDQNNIVAVEAAKIIEAAGANMITVHGRTRSEFYSGKADLDIIKKVKESVKIPVIGNGDIIDEESAKKMFEYTGVDGIMIGRASFGNPWIFREIINYLKTGEKLPKPSKTEKLETIKRHIQLEVEEKSEEIAIKEMRKHLSWYIKNMEDSSKMRQKINMITKKDEMLQAITEYFENR